MLNESLSEEVIEDIKAAVTLYAGRFATKKELWRHIAPLCGVSIASARKYGLAEYERLHGEGLKAVASPNQEFSNQVEDEDILNLAELVLSPPPVYPPTVTTTGEIPSLKFTAESSKDYELPQPKVLLFDIETAPNVSFTWTHYETNVLAYVQQWYMLAFCAKWLDSGETISRCLPDYKNYQPGAPDDREMIKELWELFNEADVLIGHNGDQFDIKKTNARFIVHGLNPPAPYKTIDTKKVARKYFRFNSNKLDDLGNTLGVGRKVKHTGFDLWQDCMNGDLEAWEVMRMYNRQDVLLLERVYHKLKPFMTNHPNMSVLSDLENGCPVCASTEIIKRGFALTPIGRKQRYQCTKCGAWATGRHTKTTDVR